MLKEKIKKYLDEYFKRWREDHNSLPQIGYDDSKMSSLYVGEVLNEEYIQWQYVPVNRIIDFSELEKKYHICISEEIKEYYNSYFFLDLDGFVEDEYIWFDPIEETTDVLSELEWSYTNEEAHGIIFIGSGANDPMGVKISNGNVIFWNEECERETFVANSLTELFSNITPKLKPKKKTLF